MPPPGNTAQVDNNFNTADSTSGRWSGTARVPHSYFPPNVEYFNLFSVHNVKDGSSSSSSSSSFEGREYECLFPVPAKRQGGEEEEEEGPNFHRLEHFGDLGDADEYLPGNR